MNIPKDPFILLSFINTKLRDEYSDLDVLCRALDIERSWLETTLSALEYTYSPAQNSFTSQP